MGVWSILSIFEGHPPLQLQFIRGSAPAGGSGVGASLGYRGEIEVNIAIVQDLRNPSTSYA